MESSCPTSLLWTSQLFDLMSHHRGKESSQGSRGGSGLALTLLQLYTRPWQEEPSLCGIAMVPLGHSVTSSPTLDLSGLVPQAWVPQASLSGIPGHSSQAQIACTLRQSQYSPCAKGVHARAHMHAHMECRPVCSDVYTSQSQGQKPSSHAAAGL